MMELLLMALVGMVVGGFVGYHIATLQLFQSWEEGYQDAMRDWADWEDAKARGEALKARHLADEPGASTPPVARPAPH